MGVMKDYDRRLRAGGDDAIAAAGELLESHERLRDDMIDKITAEFARPRWIPIGERLPDRNVNVLVSVQPGAGQEDSIGDEVFVASLDEGGMWFSTDPLVDAYSLGEQGAPTHWMPRPRRPDPPKETR